MQRSFWLIGVFLCLPALAAAQPYHPNTQIPQVPYTDVYEDGKVYRYYHYEQPVKKETPPPPAVVAPQPVPELTEEDYKNRPPQWVYDRYGHRGEVEAGVFYHKVTDGFGDWSGVYAKGEVRQDERNSWHAEVQAASQFDDDGLYGSIGNTHHFNYDWYSVVTFGAGASDFYLPRYRIDAFLYKKWLQDRRLITYIGTGYSEAQQINNDKHITLGSLYYFGGPWIGEAGVRFNISDPGSVDSRSHYVALTHHEDHDHTLTGRFAFGNESYQNVGPQLTQLVDFNSQEGYVLWKNWLTNDWGYSVQFDAYDNPFYSRYGGRLGFFREF